MMAENKKPHRIRGKRIDDEIRGAEKDAQNDRPARGIDAEREDEFHGDRDILDEASPLDFQLEEEGEIIPSEFETDPAQNLRINHYNIEDPAAQFKDFTSDPEVLEDFVQRQTETDQGRRYIGKIKQHHGQSPQVTADDVDAAWDRADQAGEEAVGGSNPTPDQDIVEEIGEAAGLTYRDDEPLDYSKVQDRDRHRWELNPASSADELDNRTNEDNDFGVLKEDEVDGNPELDEEDLESLDELIEEELEDDLESDEEEDDWLEDDEDNDDLFEEEDEADEEDAGLE